MRQGRDETGDGSVSPENRPLSPSNTKTPSTNLFVEGVLFIYVLQILFKMLHQCVRCRAFICTSYLDCDDVVFFCSESDQGEEFEHVAAFVSNGDVVTAVKLLCLVDQDACWAGMNACRIFNLITELYHIVYPFSFCAFVYVL